MITHIIMGDLAALCLCELRLFLIIVKTSFTAGKSNGPGTTLASWVNLMSEVDEWLQNLGFVVVLV